MKVKLAKFSEFVDGILPLEADFLAHFQRFEDEEKRFILEKIIERAKNPSTNIHFDEGINKRKYSYVKNWCESLLSNLDVDKNMEQLLRWESWLFTDSLSLKVEKELLHLISRTEPSDFNFIKIYDLGRLYRHYLQIRLRYKDYQKVNQFLSKFRTDYEFSKLVNDKLHETTHDIITDYSQKNNTAFTDSFPWLSSLFFNENLDGYNRLLAWIRMVFIAHNMRQYNLLADAFQHFEKLVTSGKLYSRRIVTNFYSHYLLYYASQHHFTKAEEYGYLSIKEKNNDYLYYINNLAAVLLRNGKSNEALTILKNSSLFAKNSLNYHNKIGHTAYTIFALIDSGKPKQAENHAFAFMTAFKKEIFEHRWHLFFNAYIKAMLVNGNYSAALKTFAHFKLRQKDTVYMKSANYIPSLPCMFYLASYKVGEISFSELQNHLHHFGNGIKSTNPYLNNSDLKETIKMVLKNEFVKLNLKDFLA